MGRVRLPSAKEQKIHTITIGNYFKVLAPESRTNVK